MAIKGLKITDILAMTDEDINKMSAKELKEVTQRLASAANKRIKRLEKVRSTYSRGNLATQSKAYQGLVNRDTGKVRKFSTRSKALGVKQPGDLKGKLHHEFSRAKSFLEAKTSTIEGTRELANQMSNKLKFKTKEAETAFWDLYKKIAQNAKDMIGGDNTEGYMVTSSNFQRVLYDRVFQGKSPTKSNIKKPKAIIKEMGKYLDKIYEARKKAQQKQEKDESTGIRFKFEKIDIFKD